MRDEARRGRRRINEGTDRAVPVRTVKQKITCSRLSVHNARNSVATDSNLTTR